MPLTEFVEVLKICLMLAEREVRGARLRLMPVMYASRQALTYRVIRRQQSAADEIQVIGSAYHDQQLGSPK